MSRYSEQSKRNAVALYENNEDLSLNAASAELGINRASLHSWVKKYGTGKRARIKVRDCQMRVFGTGVLGTRYCRVPGSWYRAEGSVGPDGLQFQGGITASRLHR